MSKTISQIADSIAYHLFGYVSKKRREQWQSSIKRFKEDHERDQRRQRALLIISRPSFDDLNYIEDE